MARNSMASSLTSESEMTESETAASQLEPTVEEHARSRGYLFTDDDGEPHYHWAHAAAATLHGWNQCRLDTGRDLPLSHSNYDAALRAAELYPTQAAHKPAVYSRGV